MKIKKFKIVNFEFDLFCGLAFKSPAILLEKYLSYLLYGFSCITKNNLLNENISYNKNEIPVNNYPNIPYPLAFRQFKEFGMVLDQFVIEKNIQFMIRAGNNNNILIYLEQLNEDLLEKEVHFLARSIEANIIQMAIGNYKNLLWIEGTCLQKEDYQIILLHQEDPKINNYWLEHSLVNEDFKLLSKDIIFIDATTNTIVNFPRINETFLDHSTITNNNPSFSLDQYIEKTPKKINIKSIFLNNSINNNPHEIINLDKKIQKLIPHLSKPANSIEENFVSKLLSIPLFI